jgi:hypothetical protein
MLGDALIVLGLALIVLVVDACMLNTVAPRHWAARSLAARHWATEWILIAPGI